MPGRQSEIRTACGVTGQILHVLRKEYQRSRRDFREAEPVRHLRAGDPSVILDNHLRHLGENDVGTVEGNCGVTAVIQTDIELPIMESDRQTIAEGMAR